MDPLSITTSILTLIGAASKTYGFLQFIRHADEDATSLCVEVSGLESVLLSVQAALKRCGGNPLNLASIDHDLWRRIDMTLSDCRETLDELSQLAQRIRMRHSAFVPGLFYRARVAKRMQQHSKDIASYRDRIRMSNWNLQTLLQVIDVSLSLANRDSQAIISSQLDLLNRRVEDGIKVSLCLNRFNSTSERRFFHNMEDFLQAIRAFHKAASTTAGTIQGHRGHGQGTTGVADHYESSSVVSRMPTRKRHEIVTLLQRNEQHAQTVTTLTGSQDKDIEATVSPLEGQRLFTSGVNLTTVFTDGFSKLAHKAIQDLDFLGAETFLRRAMEHHRNTGIDNVQHRRLRKQLALSLFFQGRDKEAKELVLDLAEHYGEGFNTTSRLLFALALSLAHALEFDEARTICEHLCQIRCISDDTNSGILSKNDIFRLLVTCYRQSRDWMSADAILAEISDIDEDQCVPTPLEFILESSDLLLEFLGDAGCHTTPSIFVSQVQTLPVAKRISQLQERLDGASIFTTRFAASENGDDHGDGLLRLKSGHLRSPPQAVESRPKKNHALIWAKYARLSSSLKHLAFQSRRHSSFQLLRWQRCTPEVQRPTPGRDILSWMEGQAADHGTIPAIETLSNDAEYSVAVSSFNRSESVVAELDTGSTMTVAPLPQFEAQDGAAHTPLQAPSPRHCTNADPPVVNGTRHIKGGLTWDPVSLTWVSLAWVFMPDSARHVPQSQTKRDADSGPRMTTTSLKSNDPYCDPSSAMLEETEIHELPLMSQGVLAEEYLTTSRIELQTRSPGLCLDPVSTGIQRQSGGWEETTTMGLPEEGQWPLDRTELGFSTSPLSAPRLNNDNDLHEPQPVHSHATAVSSVIPWTAPLVDSADLFPLSGDDEGLQTLRDELRHHLEVMPMFSSYAPINDPYRYPMCFEVSGSGDDQTLPRVLHEPRGEPSVVWAFPPNHSSLRKGIQLKAAVEKHVRRTYSKYYTYKCPVCLQVFRRADNVKPHVARKHPEKLGFLYPVKRAGSITQDLRFVADQTIQDIFGRPLKRRHR